MQDDAEQRVAADVAPLRSATRLNCAVTFLTRLDFVRGASHYG
jgi:hypothetical protein